MFHKVSRWCAVMAIAVCACSSTPDIMGTYALQTIGSAALPVTIGGGSLIIVSQSLELEPDETVMLVEVHRPVVGGQPQPEETISLEGTWSRVGDEVTVFTSRDATRYAIEDDGRVLRSVARQNVGPGLDALYEYLLRRP